ncbi:MAG: glycine cleavage system protein GcvH [Spirochaetaceae bacterium]|nr:glycine cleavage system protein GcvH [Spirochaetaceae bacterium]
MELRYSVDHHWVRRDSEERITVGLSDFAQREMGEVAYLELPEVGTRVAAGAAVSAIESLKSAGELYAPVAGTIVARNEALARGGARLINSDPLGAGWLFVMEMDDPGEFETLLSASEYARRTAGDLP